MKRQKELAWLVLLILGIGALAFGVAVGLAYTTGSRALGWAAFDSIPLASLVVVVFVMQRRRPKDQMPRFSPDALDGGG